MEIGLTVHPDEYNEWYQCFAGPKFARVFSPPGAGLPSLKHSKRINGLPPGCVPWISHKDRLDQERLDAYWLELAAKYPGQEIRWTYHHEPAPDLEKDIAGYSVYWSALWEASKDHPQIRPVQIQSNYALRFARRGLSWRDWIMPGIPVAFDCYPPNIGDRYEPPESMFGLLRAAADLYGVQWGVAELGADRRVHIDDLSRSAWFYDCEDYLRSAGANFLGLWASKENRDGRFIDYRPIEPDVFRTFGVLLSPDREQS